MMIISINMRKRVQEYCLIKVMRCKCRVLTDNCSLLCSLRIGQLQADSLYKCWVAMAGAGVKISFWSMFGGKHIIKDCAYIYMVWKGWITGQKSLTRKPRAGTGNIRNRRIKRKGRSGTGHNLVGTDSRWVELMKEREESPSDPWMMAPSWVLLKCSNKMPCFSVPKLPRA